ncbi:4'-phosphopantetheinyl transferase [Cryphonectria parasitica EP155]|uniref:holo-[acyl-carrier-protein] synthase n=1 Tax=Cryphonectria parasitica (strain ATCC 38755 / EP155) TaxID=660469 RepID=A0A9P4Y8R2_CRYP1|nr:4'-phosphopantetheinyl transferase [Cryphonectria parasitica EP155]KAF3768868.1 4'-phosphopantetheinyl transferase [Cryphonectria parasitica EP155]
MVEPPAPGTQPVIVQWLVDTRKLWPKAEKTAQLETEAARALALLNPEERKSVLKYLFVRDAKMSLASHLLKHYAISRLVGIPWSKTNITRNAKTKPVYVDPATGRSPLDFNVSHQAGLVALIAGYGFGQEEATGAAAIDVGCDVVCVNEREDRDHGVIAREGWRSFVDMHADVFAPGEASYLQQGVVAANFQQQDGMGTGPRALNSFRLRCFYTLWCLREAYVKMTGDALLAPWLQALEFRNFVPPKPAPKMSEERGDGEDVVEKFDIVFEGKRVEDANVCLRSVGPDYMTCSAIRTPQNKEVGLGIRLGPYEVVEIEQILDHAEATQ